MPTLTIDGRTISVENGATILAAARRLGIVIPTLCFHPGLNPATSCMACLVRIQGRPWFMPACGTRVEEGMVVESETEEVRNARREALELLLSDHAGDCLAPCQRICPAGMNIPRLIREARAGQWAEAIRTVVQDIALPSVTSRICPAPCERGCRRHHVDEAVAIRLLERCAAETDRAQSQPYRPPGAESSGRKVAIVGAGPAGLAAAWFLAQDGHACILFDEHEAPGGRLRYGVERVRLPLEALESDIARITRRGVRFVPGTAVGRDVSLVELRSGHDAVLIAAGAASAEQQVAAFGLALAAGGGTDPHTLQTGQSGVFAAGGAATPMRLAIHAMAAGKWAAASISQFLAGYRVKGPGHPYSTQCGRLSAPELAQLMRGVSAARRVVVSAPDAEGLSVADAAAEASRCLRCDCRRADRCALRDWSSRLQARAAHVRGARRPIEICAEHPRVVYEPGKCIACGLCIQIAERAGERIGLAFRGRGFGVRVGPPLGRSLERALATCANECVAVCPTGALALKDT